MDYHKFCELIRGGEKANVDFKIQCEAFGPAGATSRAELAKDICAMANNGNIASYLLIGVSDDAKGFRSVTNEKLTDDALQDFCKKAVFPPPRVKLQRISWRQAKQAHSGKEFVIIQVGPQPRQAFRLAQDFLEYKDKTCYRRNEVWIRRGATSDIATPEEISRFIQGQPLQDDTDLVQKATDRHEFAVLSAQEQIHLITTSIGPVLGELNYVQLSEKQSLDYSQFSQRGTSIPTYWKKLGTTAVFIIPLPCLSKMTEWDFRRLRASDHFDYDGAEWESLPKIVTGLTRRRIRAVRRIWLLPVVSSFSEAQIARLFPDCRKATDFCHYYRPRLHGYNDNHFGKLIVPSSSEFIVLQKIRSLPEYTDSVKKAITMAEGTEATIVFRKKEP